MYSVRFFQRLVFLVGAAFLLTITPTSAKEVSKDKIVRALKGGNEAVRAQALDYLEKQGDDKITSAVLIKILDLDVKRRGTRDSTLRMLRMLGKIDTPESLKALADYMQAADYHIATVAAEAVGTKGTDAAFEALIGAVKSKHFKSMFGFRHVVVMSILRFDNRQAIAWAVESLPNVDGLLKVDIVNYLRQKSGKDLGREPEEWTKWWDKNKDNEALDTKSVAFGDDGRLRSPGDDGDAADGDDGGSKYYDIKIYAQKIVFVIDTSSSMVKHGARLATAKKELAQTISTLADDKYFTIIAYNTRMTPFSRGLVKATVANRDRAVKWVMYLTWARGTNSYGALGTAFSVDPNTETIMFLSDGKPTRGKIIEQQAILAAIKKENAVRKMLINTIGIYTGGERNEKFIGFMKDLAKQNTGVYREVK
ncbi:MAG: VWA domain-containing protein [Planctomycetes bacterium]|nr:VWA domain-containing protein [Planctomycetota bacterium]